jgi:methionyl-tRNA synthetase
LKDEEEQLIYQVTLDTAVNNLRHVGECLKPFLPETSEKILRMLSGPSIQRGENLFNRLRDGFPRKGDYSPPSRE